MTANQETIQFWFGLGKDLITAGVSIAAVIIAGKGLTTWRRQLYGQNTFEAARKLGGALRLFKDELHYFRSLVVFEHETEAARAKFGLEPPTGTDAARVEHRMAVIRWKLTKLIERWNDVATAAYDAELILDGRLSEHVKGCRALLQRIDSAVTLFEWSWTDRHETGHGVRRVHQRILYGTADDEFGVEANAQIDALFAYLAPYLRPGVRPLRARGKELAE